MGTFTIEEAVIPASVDAPDAADFVAGIRLLGEVESVTYGTPDIAYEPAEELQSYRNPFQPKRMLVAREAGRVVGMAWSETLAHPGTTTSWLCAVVHPDARGRGIGRALADAIEEAVRADDRTTAIAYIGVVPAPGEQLASPTGFGGVPASNRDVRFLLARGYELEQVERVSRLELPVPDLEQRLAAAWAASGPDYDTVTWVGRTPERWLEDLALLCTRMSTDAPSAGLDEPEDVWTVERLVAEDERRERENPRRLVTAGAVHVPTGRLVAFTEFSVPRQPHRAPLQYATLVLREHRGHRLGMLVKLANLAHLQEVSPGHPSVLTFNAEENRPMLDVNEALGFVPISYEGAFQKRVG